MKTTLPITPDQSLAQLAATHPGASRVFFRHGLDFCCHGQVALAEACRAKGIPAEELIQEIIDEVRPREPFERWDRRPVRELIEHIVSRYHASLKEELPRLAGMAERVEKVHADKATCPNGLAELLADVRKGLELHMQKEEQVLFPLLLAGHGAGVAAPIQAMEQEHRDHAGTLQLLREVTKDHNPPEDACGTWRALYLGLADLERELMQHIHLENNVLFPRALSDGDEHQPRGRDQ